MNRAHKMTLALAAGTAMALPVMAQVTFYEHEGFQGRSFTTERRVDNFDRYGFNDRASSVIVSNSRWEVCDDAGFQGRCVVLRPGSYSSLGAMGLNDRVSSVRALPRDGDVDESRYAPAPVVDRDYRRRRNERLFEAPVTSVRAVVSQPDRRCWVEREQVTQESRSSVPAGLAGAVIGGILGHQIGGGTGRDVATVGGAVAGAAVGARISRDHNGQPVTTQDVRRCDTTQAPAAPEYWDVTYSFRGVEHRVQLAAPPGRTVTVNRDGEPRAT
jgi:uncharacterized protein YcfJ